MSDLIFVLAGFFIPLFPMSMVFNLLYPKLPNSLMRALVLLLWPQIGLYLLVYTSGEVPNWVAVWALLTSLLYGFRALALRDVNLWICFMATSAWSLLWLVAYHVGGDAQWLVESALVFSIPLSLMVLLSAGLERRFGAAYMGLYGGLVQTMPRFSGVLVFVVLAAIATPLFPAFFIMFEMITKVLQLAPILAIGACLVWLVWSWAGARLIQGLIIGPEGEVTGDFSVSATWGYGIALLLFAAAGIMLLGGLT